MRSNARRWGIPAALLLLAAAPGRGVWAKGGKAEEGDPKVAAAVDRAIGAIAGGPFWGTILIAEGGKVVLAKGYGFADYEKRPNTPDTLFEIASTTKQFTAAAVLKLEQQKKLKTSDTLDKFFPDAPKDKKAITLDQLLHHTAGIDPNAGVPYSWVGTREKYVQEMLAKPLVSKPGEKHAYANAGYALLAAVVEEATKGEFEAYLRKELFAPAGLEDTGFIQDERLVKSNRVTKRACDDCEPQWTAANWWYGWGYRGMGGVVSTALDLLKWDRVLRGTKVLGDAAKKKLYTPALEGYACGWMVGTGDRGGTRVFHTGGVRGYAVQFARWLDDDLVLVILSNGKQNPYDVERVVLEAFRSAR